MSYTIEVYHGNQKAERHLGIYALYVMFYPQLVAGPIERPQNLIHQFYERHYFEYKRVTDGLKLMFWGLFKKIVIADRLAELVNRVYDHPHQYSGIPLILATVLLLSRSSAIFRGYSDIAIGAAQVMGFKLMDNFNRPISRSRSRSVLETLAYIAIDLVQGLSLYPVGWKSRWYFALVFQSLLRVFDEWPLAWCELDLRSMGCAARIFPRLCNSLGQTTPQAS